MTFSDEWETVYDEGKQWSLYPWSDMVGLVMGHAATNTFDCKPKVLELGCGVGANIPFFLDKGFEYHAIEGSRTAVEYIRTRWSNQVSIMCGDFTDTLPFAEGHFDLVVDRSSTTHNTQSAIEGVLSEVKRVLKPGHLFIICDWFSTKHSGYLKGESLEKHTCHNFDADCQFAEVGIVHFFDKPELLSLFHQWHILLMDHKLYEASIPHEEIKLASWNVVAKND